MPPSSSKMLLESLFDLDARAGLSDRNPFHDSPLPRIGPLKVAQRCLKLEVQNIADRGTRSKQL